MIPPSFVQATRYRTHSGWPCSQRNRVPLCEEVEKLSSDEIVNTIGCGDSFAAGFAAAIQHRKQKDDKEEDDDWVHCAVQAGHHAASLNAKTLLPGSII